MYNNIKRLGNYKDGFYYIDDKNKIIKDNNILNWIKTLKIPPAYINVIIYKNDKKIKAYGYDLKGRKQVLYKDDYIKNQNNKKYNKILKYNKIFIKFKKYIINKILNIKKDENNKENDILILIYIILSCGFRIGNKKYKEENNSYGISTILYKHINFNNNIIIIDFIGKKGVRNISKINNINIYNYLLNKKNKRTDDNINVFDCNSNDVNNYLNSFFINKKITSKDLRTWNANNLFLNFVKKEIKNKSKNPIKKAIEKVSIILHNSYNICKKSYIDPNIISIIEKNIKNDI